MKFNSKSKKEWLGIINAMGFALILAFWSSFFDRLARVVWISEVGSVNLKDASELILVVLTLVLSAVIAATDHDKIKQQVSWIQKYSWPYWAAIVFSFVYLFFIILSAPFWGKVLIPLR